jgi:hypothetical protein
VFVPPALIPSAGEGDLAVACLPEESFLASMDERKNGAGEDWNVGAADEFEKAESVGDFFVAPLIAAGDGDAEDLHLGRLNEGEQRLHVAAAGAGAVLIDDNFAGLLGGGWEGGQQEEGN